MTRIKRHGKYKMKSKAENYEMSAFSLGETVNKMIYYLLADTTF